MKNNWQHEYIDTNGIKLHYVTQGEGELMLMLHGFPEFWYSWRYQIIEFAKYYKVVALDLRGYNDSDKPLQKSAYTIDEFTKDVQGVILGLGYEKCILVAHDWGGNIAWNFAHTFPNMLSKLIILNLPHPAKFAEGLRTIQQLKRSWYIFLFQLPLLPEFLIRLSDYKFIESVFKKTAINPTIFTIDEINAYKSATAKPGALKAMLNYYRNIFKQGLLSQNWQTIKVCTLMIWGENDTALGKELTYGTDNYVQDLQIKYIPNCSHWVQQEQPELVNKYMREFLSIVLN